MATEPLTFSSVAWSARPLLAPRWAATLGGATKMLALRAVCTCPCPATRSGRARCSAASRAACCAANGSSPAAASSPSLAFFFVPVTVGVMAFGYTFARAGTGIIVSLLISTVLGNAVAGITTERLAKRS